METISQLEFVIGGAGKAASSSSSNPFSTFGSEVSSAFSSFGSHVSSTFKAVTNSEQFHQAVSAATDAGAGCLAGATKGIFGGPHAAVIGCAIGAGTGAVPDIVKDVSPLLGAKK